MATYTVTRDGRQSAHEDTKTPAEGSTDARTCHFCRRRCSATGTLDCQELLTKEEAISVASSRLDQQLVGGVALTANGSAAEAVLFEALPRRAPRGWFATMTSNENLLITVGLVILGHFALIVTP